MSDIEDTEALDTSTFVLVYTDPRRDYVKVVIDSEDNTDVIRNEDLLQYAYRSGGEELRQDVKNLLTYYGNPFVVFTKQGKAKQLTLSSSIQSRADLKMELKK